MMKRCFKICVLLLVAELSLGDTPASRPNVTVLTSLAGYHKTLYCVTSYDASALTWVTPYLNQNPLSRYVDEIQEDIRCDMDPREQCSIKWTRGQWKCASSLDFFHDPILDHRWERFRVMETEDDYQIVTNRLNYDDFEIAFSIRIEMDASVYFCDGDDPPRANCYWIILSGWKGTSSVIRKCEESEIPASTKKFPKSPCKDALDQKNDTVSRVRIDEWTHYILKGKQGTYTLTTLGEREPFLKYTDRTRSAFQPDHLIIKSRKGSVGIWKFHLYPFLLTTQQEQVQLGPLMTPSNGTICLALFTKMCQACQLRLTLTDLSDYIVHTQQYQNIEWTEIKFSARNLPPDKYKLVVITESGDPRQPFWALDDVRRCTENDVRVIEVNYSGYEFPTSYACYSLGLRTFKVDLKDLTDIKTSDSTCPENTFGRSCIRCNKILSEDFCREQVVCELAEGEKTKCACAAGFRGKKCQDACQGNFYGFGCKQGCGKCYYPQCDAITGSCNGYCVKGYAGDTCKIPRFPILKYPPVVNVSHISMVIQLQNVEYDGLTTPAYYMIYYKQDGQRKWQNTDEFSIDDQTPKVISGLVSDTKCTVRVLLRASNETYEGGFVKELEVTTTCASFTRNDIQINPTNVSVVITIQTSPETCPLHDYRVSIDTKNFPLIDEKFSVRSLQPDTPYNLSLFSQRTNETLLVSFNTLEGRPTEVRNLAASGTTSTETTITWEPPKMTNGKLKHYRVTYTHYTYLGCNGIVTSNESFGVGTTSDAMYTIKDLTPYSSYIIHVEGVTTMDGDPAYTQVTTLQEDAPNDEELPSLVLNQLDGYVRVSFKEKCEKWRGPLTYHALLCCSNEWCSCMNKTLKSTNEPNAYIDFRVSAHSLYDLEVKVQRTNGDFLKQALTQNFLSSPTAPSSVRNLTLYSKTEESASLRWRPPYPPTGILKDYIISYKCTSCYYSTNEISQIIKGDSCKLWPEFLCATVIIKEHDNYHFQFNVRARNEIPDQFGTPSSANGRLSVEKPEPPLNLTADWDDYHNLTLSWIHPDVTNGPLTGFAFKIDGVRQMTFKSEEQLLYNYTVTDAPPSAKITVTVAAKTQAGESRPIQTDTYSPPKPPQFSADPYLDEADNRTLSMIIPAPTDLVEDSIMYVIVTELNTERPSTTPSEIPKHIEEMAVVDGRHLSWIAEEITFADYDEKVVIGSDDAQYSKRLELSLHNRALKMGANYTVTFLLSNTYMNKTRSRVKKIRCMTAGMYEGGAGIAHLGFLGLLLLPLLCFVGFILFRKYKVSIRMPVRPIVENLRSLGSRSNPDVIPLAEAEQPQTRLQPIKPKPKQQMTAKLSTTTTVGGAKFSRLIKLGDFEAYVKEAIETGELDRQHAMFPRGQTHPWEQGTKPYNKSKNRYNNLAAYDHTRVKLEMMDGNVTTDYINANYIEGYNVSNAYIATQGPKVSTVDDFWRMIWQEGVEYIIMLANVFENGKKKVEKYWPDINQTLEFGRIQVHYVSVEVFADYESRKFSVTCDGQKRKVKQLHFVSWPDHGVPLYAQSLVPLLRKMLTIPHGKSPVVVHCSAGVGRTGTIILCDICLRMAAREGEVDVLYHQYKIREQRVNMVDNIEQFKLVHLVLIQCLVAPQTNLACTEEIGGVVEQILSGDAVDFQMKYLDDTAWQDQAMKSNVSDDEVTPVYPQKNRFADIVPDEMSRVFISLYPTSDETSSYINAVKVDGFQSVSKYIVTQQPLPNTLGDFWRLVYERDISVIVSLNTIDPTDKTCCEFWPTETLRTLETVPYLKVTYSDLMSDADFDVISAHVVNTDADSGDGCEKRVVKVLDFKNWNFGEYHPENPSQMLTAIEEVNRLGKTSKCILVTCRDGARASGLFVALTFVIDKIKLEQECDICLAVRSVRRNRSHFIRHRDQFAFLYKAAVEYVNSFKIYSNFVTGRK